MAMTDTFINISQKNIQRIIYSLILKRFRLVTIDIEVAAESGFPDVENVAEELLVD